MVAAIIPARGGSKRIPGKNIKLFAGKPIIAYSIKAALEAAIFDRVIVSTDSPEIADVAIAHGAEVPFMRPAELSDDFTATASVLRHAILWLKEQGMETDSFCCIYPTAPFLKPKYIRQGYELLCSHKVTSTFSITSFAFPIFRALKLEDNGRVVMFWPEFEKTRSNDLPPAYHDAGQFYWADTEKFLKEMRLYAHDSMGIVLPRYLVHDIDTPEDWETAEKMHLALYGQQESS